MYKKQWVTSQPPIAHFNLNLNYEKFICLFTLQICMFFLFCANLFAKKNIKYQIGSPIVRIMSFKLFIIKTM